jgi:predicted kinase
MARGLDCPKGAGVLQASYMRKWMSERLKRRKKTGDGPNKDATKAPEPLQPRFYDDEPATESGPPVETADVSSQRHDAPKESPAGESQPVAPVRSRSEPEAVTATDEASSGAEEPKARTSRRRRSRGGRGGNRGRTRGTAPAVAESLAATEPSPEEPSTAELSAPEVVVAGASPAMSQRAQSPASPATPTATAPASRASKGTVVLAIGLPGSGKSSWFKRHNIHPLSSDLLRELLFDDAQEQRFQDLVFSNLRSMLKARLIARRPMNYVDATNLTPHDRHSWIKLAKDYGYDVQGVFFDVPLEICMERHQRRGRAVPEEIMRKMAGKLKAPTFDEGFSKITVVRVKQKEAAAG